MLRLPPQHLRQNDYAGGSTRPYDLGSHRGTADSIAKRNGFTVVDGWPMPLLGVDCYVMLLPAGMAMDAAMAQVSRDPRVAWSEPMQVYQAGEGK
jgi:hypothetical protein